MAHIYHTIIYSVCGEDIQRFRTRARAPNLVLLPQETPRRYASMDQKVAIGASVRACEA